MPADCTALSKAAGGIVAKMSEADAALDAAINGYTEALSARDDAFSLLVFCPGLACKAVALAALAAAEDALSRYAEQSRILLETLRRLEGLYERVNELLAHCQQLASWQVDALDELVAEAEGLADEADGEEIEDVDPTALAGLDMAAVESASGASRDSDYG